jgi:diacylglycerol kinase family enzyme
LAVSTVSLGYAAETVSLANRYFKHLGEFCYPLAATLQAARQRAFPITVQLDETPAQERHLSNVMINNTRHAGNFSAFRSADPGDGYLEVLLARAGFVSQCLHNLAVLSHTYFYATAAEIATQRILLTPSTPQRLMVDGELWDEVTHLRCEVLPGKLRCVA